MPQRTDYSQVDVPDDKRPPAYHYTERRAEILQLVLRAGGPGAVNQSSLADRYDVDKSTISRDLDRLSASIGEQLGNHIDLTVKAAFDRTLQELLDEGEHRAAWSVVMDYSEWLADCGCIERAPVAVEGEMDHEITHTAGDLDEATREHLDAITTR